MKKILNISRLTQGEFNDLISIYDMSYYDSDNIPGAMFGNEVLGYWVVRYYLDDADGNDPVGGVTTGGKVIRREALAQKISVNEYKSMVRDGKKFVFDMYNPFNFGFGRDFQMISDDEWYQVISIDSRPRITTRDLIDDIKVDTYRYNLPNISANDIRKYDMIICGIGDYGVDVVSDIEYYAMDPESMMNPEGRTQSQKVKYSQIDLLRAAHEGGVPLFLTHDCLSLYNEINPDIYDKFSELMSDFGVEAFGDDVEYTGDIYTNSIVRVNNNHPILTSYYNLTTDLPEQITIQRTHFCRIQLSDDFTVLYRAADKPNTNWNYYLAVYEPPNRGPIVFSILGHCENNKGFYVPPTVEEKMIFINTIIWCLYTRLA